MDIGIDAQVLLTAWFLNGSKNSVRVGGKGAQSILTARGQKAMDELVSAGYVTAEPFNSFGRMLYTGTDKLGGRLDFDAMALNGQWSPTCPNPEYQRAGV